MLKFKFGLLMEKLVVRISPEGFGTIAMIVNFVVAFTVKSLEPPKMFKILNTLDSFWCRRPLHIRS
jgi:hypothetical protein